MRKKKLDSETEKKILDAAVNVFHKKGIHGARMQEIADEAQVSKSMLHYYFVDKDKLFNKVFELTMKNIFPKVNSILVSDLPLFQKIAVFMNTYTDILFEQHHSTGFIISEMAMNTDKVLKMTVSAAGFDMTKFRLQIDGEYKKGNIKKMDVRILFLNMISLCVFPFIAMPIQLQRFKISQEEYFQLLEKRKSVITQMVIDSIKKEELVTV
ncbi:MAG: TetR/AcrR family transcriptional regulator [Bacteroidetes bacterium]|nr:TetR/AcrR family transcriptional regulator [Bacteroidota bacterium]